MKDFNLHGYLRNNRLLNESIGGYKDIKALREDDEFDQWCQENPEDCKRYKQSQADADKAFTDEFGSYSSDETNDAGSITDSDGWQYEDFVKGDTVKIKDDQEYGDDEYMGVGKDRFEDLKGQTLKVTGTHDGGKTVWINDTDSLPASYLELVDVNEAEGYGTPPPEGPNSFLPTDQDLPGNDDSEYAAHMQHYSDLESEVMEIVTTLINNGVDNKEIAIWLRDIANDIDGEMMEYEEGLEEKKPVSDDQRKAIWASYNNEAEEKGEKEKPKAKGKLKEGKIRPSSSEFTWDI